MKNIEWDVSVIDEGRNETYTAAKVEFDSLWEKTLPLSQDLINEYKTRLPFTYIGTGKMVYNGESQNSNGAHLFCVPMEVTAPEDIFFDFKLPG